MPLPMPQTIRDSDNLPPMTLSCRRQAPQT